MARKKRHKGKGKVLKPDEVFDYGMIQIARYGRFIQIINSRTPEEQATFLEKMAIAHKETISELEKEVSNLQSLIQKYDPIEIMHRAAYMLLPLFLNYHSENEFTSEESYFLATAEYLQYLISRTPSNVDGNQFDEDEWKILWSSAIKVLKLTQEYLLTRPPKTMPPSEIDHLRSILDGRRLMVRVNRYPIYFTDHLHDALSPYVHSIEEAFRIDVELLVQGLEQINLYQKTGVLERYQSLREANRVIVERFRECGFLITPDDIEGEGDKIREALNSPEFKMLYKDIEEKARLALTPAVFDITDMTPLPQELLSILSIRPGESVLTKLTGPNHDDLSPLSLSPLHHKPFLEKDGRFYYFYHSGFEDRIAEIIENNIFQRFPDRASSLRRRRDEHIESLATNFLASIIKPDSDYRNLYYPDPDQLSGITEIDALLTVDDILFLVEIKAGGFSAAASRGAPDSLFDELSETIGVGQHQSERAERYIRSAAEVPFFDATGKQERFRIKHADFRQIFRVVITREDLGWVGARIAVLSILDSMMSGSFPWHVSLNDLRIVAELFQDSELRFVHYLEQRLSAAHTEELYQHDEIEHIALYNKINLYHELPFQDIGQLTFDASYMRDIDFYFSERLCGKSPELPSQNIPHKITELLQALRDSHLQGRFEVASIILSMDDEARSRLDDALKYLETGLGEGKKRSLRLPFPTASIGLTISYTIGEYGDENLIRSAAQMEQCQFHKWLAVKLETTVPHKVNRIVRILPGQYSKDELINGHEHIDRMVMKAVNRQSIGRNDPCPCGSGKKYKKCHGQ